MAIQPSQISVSGAQLPRIVIQLSRNCNSRTSQHAPDVFAACAYSPRRRRRLPCGLSAADGWAGAGDTNRRVLQGSNREIDMTESALPLDKDLIKTVGALSSELQVPMQDVADIYRTEFDRLARAARIPAYLGVLAMSNTRSILRGGATSAPLR